jgi:hypothetical protein
MTGRDLHSTQHLVRPSGSKWPAVSTTIAAVEPPSCANASTRPRAGRKRSWRPATSQTGLDLGDRSSGRGRRREARAHVTRNERQPGRQLSRVVGAGGGHPSQQGCGRGLITTDEPENRRGEHGGADADEACGSDEHEAPDRLVALGCEQRSAAAERMAHDDGPFQAERVNHLTEPGSVGVAIAGTFPRRETWLARQINADRAVLAPEECKQPELRRRREVRPGQQDDVGPASDCRDPRPPERCVEVVSSRAGVIELPFTPLANRVASGFRSVDRRRQRSRGASLRRATTGVRGERSPRSRRSCVSRVPPASRRSF